MATRKLREKQRICYYEPEEPSLDEYVFCERCADYVFEYCAIHGALLVIPDDKVPPKPKFPSFVPRAALTIPHVFLHLARSIIPGAGIGVFSTLTLPRGVRFGPYRGLRTNSVDSEYCWQIYDRNNRRSHVVDAADGSRSNWMRYVNCSRHWSEQNLVAYQYRGQLYYRTIRTIPRFTELLVFYGGEFASALRVNLAAYNAPRAYAAKFGAPVSKKPRLTTQMNYEDTPANNFARSDQTNDNIEEPKSETKRAVVDKPVEKNKIVETGDNIDIRLRNDKQNYSISGHNEPHKEMSENKISADKSVNSSSSDKLKQLLCDTCQKYFICKSILIIHIRTHTGEKPYQCNVCQKCFRRKGHLNIHMRTHTGDKPYQCNVCKKCFSRKDNLDIHTRTHTGQRPYQCNVCKKCFNHKGHLDIHMRTHTDEKPYQCNVCKKCFSVKGNLERHTRTHTGKKPYQCNVCEKCFIQRSDLNNHTRTHTGEKPFQCDICKKCFCQKCNLNKHIFTHAGKKPYN